LRTLSADDVVYIHARIIGSDGLRDRGTLESSVSQPLQSFGVAHAALAVTLRLNGCRLSASVDEQEKIMLRLASGELTRADFCEWVNTQALVPDV
jgi:death on curing protein